MLQKKTYRLDEGVLQGADEFCVTNGITMTALVETTLRQVVLLYQRNNGGLVSTWRDDDSDRRWLLGIVTEARSLDQQRLRRSTV